MKEENLFNELKEVDLFKFELRMIEDEIGRELSNPVEMEIEEDGLPNQEWSSQVERLKKLKKRSIELHKEIERSWNE